MRPIHLAQLDKTGPVVVLTREFARPHLRRLTIAPITTTVRGVSTEVPVSPANGLEHDSVIICDNVTTIERADLGRQIGFLLDHQEVALTEAILAAFDLR
jgi:mRNA interferase MazF